MELFFIMFFGAMFIVWKYFSTFRTNIGVLIHKNRDPSQIRGIDGYVFVTFMTAFMMVMFISLVYFDPNGGWGEFLDEIREKIISILVTLPYRNLFIIFLYLIFNFVILSLIILPPYFLGRIIDKKFRREYREITCLSSSFLENLSRKKNRQQLKIFLLGNTYYVIAIFTIGLLIGVVYLLFLLGKVTITPFFIWLFTP